MFSNLEGAIPSLSLGNPRRGEVKSPGCHRECVVVKVFSHWYFFYLFFLKLHLENAGHLTLAKFFSEPIVRRLWELLVEK